MATAPPGNLLMTTVQKAANWARTRSMFPATFGLACCAIEMMASGTALDGSMTTRRCFQVSFIASMISSSDAVKISETWLDTKCQVRSFSGTSRPSAMVFGASSAMM